MLDKTGNRQVVVVHAGAFRRQHSFIRNNPGRNATIAIALDHCQGPAGKISEPAGEIAVGAIDQVLVAEAPVLTKHHLTQTEITNGIDRKIFVENVELDCVAECL